MYGELVSAAKERELAECQKFKVLKEVAAGTPPEDIVDPSWVTPWKMVEGAKDVKVRLAAEGTRGRARRMVRWRPVLHVSGPFRRAALRNRD